MSKVTIPPTTKEMTATLGELDAFVTAKEWHRAAIVWAFTESDSGRRTDLARKRARFTITEFASRGIHGLRTRNTVIAYREAWQWAMDNAGAPDVRPGDRVQLPDVEWPGRTDAEGQKRYTVQEPGPFARTLNRGAVDPVTMVNELTPAVRHEIARAVMSNPKEAREVIKHRDVQNVVTEAQLERTMPRGTPPPNRDRDLDMYYILVKAQTALLAVRRNLPDFIVDEDLADEALDTANDAETTAQFIKDWVKGKTLASEADDFLRSQR